MALWKNGKCDVKWSLPPPCQKVWHFLRRLLDLDACISVSTAPMDYIAIERCTGSMPQSVQTTLAPSGKINLSACAKHLLGVSQGSVIAKLFFDSTIHKLSIRMRRSACADELCLCILIHIPPVYLHNCWWTIDTLYRSTVPTLLIIYIYTLRAA